MLFQPVARTEPRPGRRAAQAFLNTSEAPAQAFAKGTGGTEFCTDGVTVNTTEGWRDLRVNVFDKREAERRRRRPAGPTACRRPQSASPGRR